MRLSPGSKPPLPSGTRVSPSAKGKTGQRASAPLKSPETGTQPRAVEASAEALPPPQTTDFAVSPPSARAPKAGALRASTPDGAETSLELSDAFKHEKTMCLFRDAPSLEALNFRAIESQDGLDEVLDAFSFHEDDGVLFNPKLETDGVTKPGEDAEVGRSTWKSSIRTDLETVELSQPFQNLHIATTAAHELTHRRQYDELPHIEAPKGSRKSLPKTDQIAIENAMNKQEAVLEALAYQSEVVNLNGWHSGLKTPLSPDEEKQFTALVDQASGEASQYFDRLSTKHKQDFLGGKIETIMHDIINALPSHLQREPFVKLP